VGGALARAVAEGGTGKRVVFGDTVVLKTIFLPGQARDKRREQLSISTLLQEAEAAEGGC
jgi:hypothetical protein